MDNPFFCLIKSTENYEVHFVKNEGIIFPSEKIPSIVGFTGILDKHGVHIGYKMNTATSNNCCLMFISTNIIEYQYVGDAKAPLLRVIDSKQRLKNSSVSELEPTHGKVFSNLEYKKLLTKTINFHRVTYRNRPIISHFRDW